MQRRQQAGARRCPRTRALAHSRGTFVVQARDLRQAAAEHDHLGVEQVDHARERAREPRLVAFEAGLAGALAGRGATGDACGVEQARRRGADDRRPGPGRTGRSRCSRRVRNSRRAGGGRRPRAAAAGCGPTRRPPRWPRPAACRRRRCRRPPRCRGWPRTPSARPRRHRPRPRTWPGSWRRWRGEAAGASRASRSCCSGLAVQAGGVGVADAAVARRGRAGRADADAGTGAGDALGLIYQRGDRVQGAGVVALRRRPPGGASARYPAASSTTSSILVPPRSMPMRVLMPRMHRLQPMRSTASR